MRRPLTRWLSVAFFCSSGWVYNASALRAEDVEPVDSAEVEAAEFDIAPPAELELEAQIAPPATQPVEEQVQIAPPAPAAANTPVALPAEVPQAAAPVTRTGLFDGSTDTATPTPALAGGDVAVGSFGHVELHVKDAELTQVLQLLSIQSQRNIVATKSVTGTISADLYGVEFYEALDAILHTNGYGYREKGSFIYVYTLEELRQIDERERKLTHRVVRLNYITAPDAAAFIAPLKSPVGSIAVSGDTPAGFQATVSNGGANSSADSDLVILRDYPEIVDEMAAVIAQLDVRPKQVLVEASILQARLNENNAWGVDLTVVGDFALGQFGSPLNVVDQMMTGGGPSGTGGGVTTSVGNTASGPGTKVGIVSNNVAAFIKALDAVTDTTVLANPKLLVLNRQRASLLVGERLGYLSTTASETSTTQTVEFLDVGTELILRPFVSDDDFIRLEIQPSISDGETRTVGSLVIPNQTTQELTTNVMVPSGRTVVLGGLFKEDTTVSRRQVPVLGSLPVVGWGFRGQDDTVERSEVIFLITPSIVKDHKLYDAGDALRDDVRMVSASAQSRLLPWSREKLTAAHVRDATEHYRAGERDKALWSADRALSLSPTNVEALQIKQQLGQRVFIPERSLLNHTLDRMVGEQLNGQPAATQPAAGQ